MLSIAESAAKTTIGDGKLTDEGVGDIDGGGDTDTDRLAERDQVAVLVTETENDGVTLDDAEEDEEPEDVHDGLTDPVALPETLAVVDGVTLDDEEEDAAKRKDTSSGER